MIDTHLSRRLGIACILGGSTLSLLFAASAGAAPPSPKPKFSQAVAFDVSRPAREMPLSMMLRQSTADPASEEPFDIRPDRGPIALDTGFSGDAAMSPATARMMLMTTPAIAGPLANFEGLSNQDNFNIFGFRVNPPDPVGDVGPNHYVEMVNLAFAVYDKQGNLLLGPVDTGDAVGGLRGRRLHRPVGRPDRGVRPARGPLAPEPVHDARLTTRCLLQLRRDLADRRSDRRVLPLRVHHAAGSGLTAATSSPTTRSTACGRTRTS